MTHATKPKALAAARRRWGKHAFVREDRRAPSPAERERLTARSRELVARVQAIDAELKDLGAVLPPLIKAARFAVDVDGGAPSLEQLRPALERAERQVELNQERRDCRQEQDGLALHRRRWDAGTLGPLFAHIHASADTLDELLAKIGGAS